MRRAAFPQSLPMFTSTDVPQCTSDLQVNAGQCPPAHILLCRRRMREVSPHAEVSLWTQVGAGSLEHGSAPGSGNTIKITGTVQRAN